MDEAIVTWINQIARHSESFDGFVDALTLSNLVKGGIPMAIWCACWLGQATSEMRRDVRDKLIAVIAAIPFALLLGRFMALTLPFRDRPIHDPGMEFVAPFGAAPDRLAGWSAMPSDHAVVGFALVAGMFCVNRRVGWFLAAFVLLLVGLPRIYVGLHYPSDIAVGAIVGLTVGGLFQQTRTRQWIGAQAQKLENWSPAVFYGCLALACMQTAVMFDDVRLFGNLALDAIKAVAPSVN